MRLFAILVLIIVVGVGVASRIDNLRRNAQWQKLNDFFNRATAQATKNDSDSKGAAAKGQASEKADTLFPTLKLGEGEGKGSRGQGQGGGQVGSVPLRSLYERVAVNNTLLQSLAERTSRLDEREKTVQARETVLAALQKKVEEREDSLKKTRDEIKALLARYEGEQSGGLKQLVGIYSNVDPKRAAAIFNELDLDIVVSLLRQMPSRRVAPILAAMDPEKARRITLELSE